ncbi:hypothetical protein CK203_061819 [Vitis vinifera]|uniref:Uncharacterized protein n=1 Tax=Vitis vinifera TaxID=29760 RepID=A0A438GIX5_VITVI|nr:hypothetical protein CK203_061819 [Vitis vinifera]
MDIPLRYGNGLSYIQGVQIEQVSIWVQAIASSWILKGLSEEVVGEPDTHCVRIEGKPDAHRARTTGEPDVHRGSARRAPRASQTRTARALWAS